MSEKLFWIEPYKTELDSKVLVIEDNKIELSQTIFYAQSGGQESDTGTINNIPVIKAEKKDNSIIYTLASSPNFKVGDEVHTSIDWKRRYQLMKLHFAAELVLELFYKEYKNIQKIGAHISEDKSRIDFELEENISPLLANIQTKAQELIDKDLPIQSDFSDKSKGKRFWKIEGFAQVPCGGTHLKRTSEIGKISLKRKNIGKGKERVEIFIN
ncbi:alanyl-tRNA editing protein [Halarcobacter ebronensis]|uniref:Alanyl-tRNA editing protein n=1 Tax=Halarcobacter ebronensis TaxID=1462615 RepID=A0A4Q0YG76_9BACT|nr:alanyl-tRNA editing protein [Halarcobacter ebronensis]RXJ69273.1 alanyl-tRNA editing protein [Halarcobacter ebronensis]